MGTGRVAVGRCGCGRGNVVLWDVGGWGNGGGLRMVWCAVVCVGAMVGGVAVDGAGWGM